METRPEHPDLGEKISAVIQNGITLTDDVVHYIDSTFSNPDVDEFRRILTDPADCEADTVCELIFYPDQPMQEKIESFLITRDYNQDEVESAARHLLQKEMIVPVTFPDQRGTFPLRLTEPIIRQFLDRLHLTRQIDPRLELTLSRVVEDMSENLMLRVMLRNCRTNFSEPAARCLCACIELMFSESPYFTDAFRFLLDFFDYADPEADIYWRLMEEKKALLQSIDQAEKGERALMRNSVESLMLRGVNILAINIAEARKKMVLIDHICISIFGKTGPCGQMESPVTVRDFTPEDFWRT